MADRLTGDDHEGLGVAVISIGSDRSLETDPVADKVVDRIAVAGHSIAIHEVVADDRDELQRTVIRLVDRSDVDVVVTTGGLEVADGAGTDGTLRKVSNRSLPGVGEAIRATLREERGVRAVADRSFAVVRNGVVICSLPLDERTVELALGEVFVPALSYLVDRTADA